MRQLSIQPGSPGSPLPYCHLQPQGCHIQTSRLYLARSVRSPASHTADATPTTMQPRSVHLSEPGCRRLTGPADGRPRCHSAN